MTERSVVNASPLIFLARTRLMGLLLEVGPRVVVPAAVETEIRAYGPTDPIVLEVSRTSWLDTEPVGTIPDVILAWDLGTGESAVLAWALSHPGTEAILDDLAGRRCADALGISHRGTLGLVLLAWRRGKIPAARPVVETLRGSWMYLSDGVVDGALALVGE